MNAQAILNEIKPLGTENYRKILRNHGVPENCFGVKIEELKKIQKRVKKDYKLALELYDTGIYDAQYLAGLIADDEKMTKKDLQKWVKGACEPIAAYTVAWVAAGSPYGHDIALEWIDSPKETVAVAGWGTLCSLVALKDDADLDLAELKSLLKRVQKTILSAPNRVRYQMNNFVISVGCYVAPLTKLCLEIGEKIGPVEVDMGDTSRQVPYSPDYIRKVEKRGTIGKKRKTVKC